jgi:hypothetical protein
VARANYIVPGVNGAALVTGSADRVAMVQAALQRLDCTVVAVDDLSQLAAACSSLGPAAVDHYVQLPVDVPSSGGTVVSRLHAFLTCGLMARFEAAALVLPTLRAKASVILVAGNLPAELTAPDDRQARIFLLRVLAQALVADTAPVSVRTVIVGHTRSADEIAEITVDPAAHRLRVIAEAAEGFPEMSYDDWRLAMLGLASIES